ncbi:MAG TPA: winged helix-turn-helix domain-containing protein [Nitrososphaeraceae archaeon]
MKSRDREEIFASILMTTGSGGGARITRIMFSSFLTHTQALVYTKLLIERGFLYYDNINKSFGTTSSGFEFLQLYDELSEIISAQKI